LERAELELLKIFGESHQFTAEDICNIHELWLGDIYAFAGRYRTVNMAKEDFLFAQSGRIADLMIKLENDFLSKYTPCRYSNTNELAKRWEWCI
jgi:cell filamentation protein